MNILIVEDDPGISDVLEYALQAEGHVVTLETKGAAAITSAPGMDFVLLDVGLPDMNGFDVCRKIRKTSDIPILFLTSRAEEIDRIVGLEIGADDYLAKPFSTRELIARINAIVRRTETGRVKISAPVALPDTIIDRESRSVTSNGQSVDLTRLEFDVLGFLLDHPGRVFTRDQILNGVWPDGGCVTDRTIDAHIKALRRKLGDGNPIETIRGVGYRARKTGT